MPCQTARKTIGIQLSCSLVNSEVDSHLMPSALPSSGSGFMKMYLNT